MESYYKVLSIAGSDCSGGAGIQADLKTCSALGTYCMTAITAITAQNTFQVNGIENISPGMVGQQIDAIYADIIPDSIKIGMLPTKGIIELKSVSPKKSTGSQLEVLVRDAYVKILYHSLRSLHI